MKADQSSVKDCYQIIDALQCKCLFLGETVCSKPKRQRAHLLSTSPLQLLLLRHVDHVARSTESALMLLISIAFHTVGHSFLLFKHTSECFTQLTGFSLDFKRKAESYKALSDWPHFTPFQPPLLSLSSSIRILLFLELPHSFLPQGLCTGHFLGLECPSHSWFLVRL